MKLLNRLRELRNESSSGLKIEETNSTNNQHLDLLGVGSTTADDIVRLNITQMQYQSLYQYQD